MSKDYQNSGALGKNRRKETETQASHTGNAKIICPHCGVESAHWINAWVKEGRDGKFFSLSFKAKDQVAKPTTTLSEDLDDDIPF